MYLHARWVRVWGRMMYFNARWFGVGGQMMYLHVQLVGGGSDYEFTFLVGGVGVRILYFGDSVNVFT